MKKKRVRKTKTIEDYALHSTYGWEWLTSTLEKYNEEQIRKMKDRFKKDGIAPTVGINAILDLYKRVKTLEKVIN